MARWAGPGAATGSASSRSPTPASDSWADAGLFHDGNGLGRFQHVSTHPEWRRRGLCRALIHAAARRGFETMGLSTLVIVADPRDVAIHAYEQVGFARRAEMHQLQRSPPARSQARS